MPKMPDYSRRRAEDVFRTLENEVFPKFVSIDTRVEKVEHGIKTLMFEGCARRPDDLNRIAQTEEGIERIFEKIDDIGNTLGDARIDMVRQIGGIKNWVLTGVVIILLAVAGYFLKDHFDIYKRTAVVQGSR